VKRQRIYSGYVRIGAAVPRCRVAAVDHNRDAILGLWQRASDRGVAVVVFPELCLTGYTARDLFLDQQLQQSCTGALEVLLERSQSLAPLVIIGVPLRVAGHLFNVALALQGGRIVAAVPKTYLPSYREFEEARWFRSGAELPDQTTITLLGQTVPIGTDLLLAADDLSDLTLGIELCEDGWVQHPPGAFQASAGATLICNLSASNFLVGKAELRRLLVRSTSDRAKCAYVYCGAGPGESSTDLAFDADAFICEDGIELVSSQRFSRDDQLITVDIDLDRLIHARTETTSFGDCAALNRRAFRRVGFRAGGPVRAPLDRVIDPHPFLPKDQQTLSRRCWEIFEIQTNALITRMQAANLQRLVLGISGGLDSTHAALVCATALDAQGLPRKHLRCITMPGLGTTSQTRSSAEQLALALSARFEEISITEAAKLVLTCVAHPAVQGVDQLEGLFERLRAEPDLADVALENVQARLRTLLLMTLANMADGALVVGTGDLSEKALGWSTYAGDQISMYDVNAGVPKTLIQFVIRWVANERLHTWTRGNVASLRKTLFEILDTPISPELIPAGSDGSIAQLTEAVIGPYELHDFFLYQMVRHRAGPVRILDVAQIAFAKRYQLSELKRWLSLFVRRFFHNQFKRSCTADGPKVGMVALSPRGDWRMPSDADVSAWLDQIERYQ
jgi:NAD+ synthase (glutamine-hydrolysing)